MSMMLGGMSIPRVPAPGVEEASLDDSRGGRRSRRDGRSSGGRSARAGRGRGKARTGGDERQSSHGAPREVAANQTNAKDEARTPRREKSHSAPANDEARNPRREKSRNAPTKERERSRDKGPSGRRSEDVIGLGDHVPAFLLRKP